MSYAEVITLAQQLKETLESDSRVVLLTDLDQKLNQNQHLLLQVRLRGLGYKARDRSLKKDGTL